MRQPPAAGAVYRSGIRFPRAEPLPRKSRDTSSKSLARGCHSRKQIQDRRVRVVEEVSKNPLELTTYRRHTLELRKAKNCPKCGSKNLMEIVYGRPTSEALDAVERGEIALGGCVMMPNQPNWKCATCGYEWFDRESPGRISREQLYS